MWYDKLGVISIGGHCGGPEDGGLGDIKIALWKLFLRHCKATYCPTVAHYALLLVIGGEFQAFGPESIEKLRRNKRDKTIGVYIVIPEMVWRVRTLNQLRDYLAKRIREAIELCVERLVKDKEQVDKASLFREVEVEEAIGEFLKIDYENNV